MSDAPPVEQRKDWINIAFLTVTPILAIPVLIWHTIHTGFALWMPALFLGMYILVGLSICAGYHRFYSHKSYECSKLVQIFFAVFGAMGAQNSIIRWSSGHRRHHAYAESDWDPYSITRGFWWAHFIWVFYIDANTDNFDNARDLQANPIVCWQDRWYRTLLLAGGFGIPLLVGALFGNPIAGLLWGGFLRIVVVHHSTFLVNSLAHHVGRKTYDIESTARDNWAVALLTFGEGYHSFHHRFPSDFRNGIRWHNWDPAKWLIQGLKLTGLASNLNITAAPQIEQAQMKELVKRFEERIARAEQPVSAEIRRRIQCARDSFEAALASWRAHAAARREGRKRQRKEAYRIYRMRLKEARREWRDVLRACKRLPDPT